MVTSDPEISAVARSGYREVQYTRTPILVAPAFFGPKVPWELVRLEGSRDQMLPAKAFDGTNYQPELFGLGLSLLALGYQATWARAKVWIATRLHQLL